MMTTRWFDVDKAGLGRLLSKNGKAFAIYELLQNALDTDAKHVEIELKYHGRLQAELYISDDSTGGFHDLSHAYTLFAPSTKLADPEKRGRFNLGEKLFLSICESAEIASTKGTVYFHAGGERLLDEETKTKRGSVIRATLKADEHDIAEMLSATLRVLIPQGKTVLVNGEKLEPKLRVRSFHATLPTVAGNVYGEMLRTSRSTRVDVYNTSAPGWIYELGIPVVETGDRYDVDVQQKVPLSMSRDNVPPGFLSKLRAHVLNATVDILSADDASEKWVDNALERPEVEPRAVERVLTSRFGEKRAVYDPSDPEANALATSKGYTVIPGRTFSKAAWSSIRSAGAAKPAGQVTPSPKPFSEDGQPLKTFEPNTAAQAFFVTFTKKLAHELLGVDLTVTLTKDPGWNFTAAYTRGDGNARLTVNAGRVGGARFFEAFHPDSTDASKPKNLEAALSLLVHEFAHHFEGNHLSEGYYRACTNLGAKLAIAIATKKIELPLINKG